MPCEAIGGSRIRCTGNSTSPSARTPAAAQAQPRVAAPDTDWLNYAGDKASTRYSPLDQIDLGNFKGLEVAWRFSTSPFGPTPEYILQCTPLVAKGRMYLTAGNRRSVVCIDAATAEVIWVHRGAAEAGTSDHLLQALKTYGKPEGRFFVQGFAEARLITDIRKYLREDWGLDHKGCRVSGFWRRGKDLTEAARIGYARVDALAAAGKVLDEEEFSKFLEYD